MGVSLDQYRVAIGKWSCRGPKRKRNRLDTSTDFNIEIKSVLIMDDMYGPPVMKRQRKFAALLLTFMLILTVAGILLISCFFLHQTYQYSFILITFLLLYCIIQGPSEAQVPGKSVVAFYQKLF